MKTLCPICMLLVDEPHNITNRIDCFRALKANQLTKEDKAYLVTLLKDEVGYLEEVIEFQEMEIPNDIDEDNPDFIDIHRNKENLERAKKLLLKLKDED